jgi:hypothetical protein
VSATANVVTIAAIITKVGPSNHDERHQATLGLLPRSLVTANYVFHAHELVGEVSGNRGVTRTVLWMRSMVERGALVSYGPSVHSREAPVSIVVAAQISTPIASVVGSFARTLRDQKNTQAKSSADTWWHAHSLADQYLETSLADLFDEPPMLIHDNLAMRGGSSLCPQPLHSSVMDVAAALPQKKGTQIGTL